MLLQQTAPNVTTTPFQRLRRNRLSASIRNLVQETHLSPSQLVAPLFIREGSGKALPINGLEGIFSHTLDTIIAHVCSLSDKGISSFLLFPVIARKNKSDDAAAALSSDNVVVAATRAIKGELPDLCVMVDAALDPYTDHGHDGIAGSSGTIDNDGTVAILQQMALMAADAGADIIAPSDMMDGRVKAIRCALDAADHPYVGILSYAAKYASAFYGPFRDLLDSAPRFGDKKSYQLNPANWREAMRECQTDIDEGADMLLVKPSLPYLDIIAKLRATTTLPIGAYHTSGEYACIMSAAKDGFIDADKAFDESMLAIRRAGADFIITYAAERLATKQS